MILVMFVLKFRAWKKKTKWDTTNCVFTINPKLQWPRGIEKNTAETCKEQSKKLQTTLQPYIQEPDQVGSNYYLPLWVQQPTCNESSRRIMDEKAAVPLIGSSILSFITSMLIHPWIFTDRNRSGCPVFQVFAIFLL